MQIGSESLHIHIPRGTSFNCIYTDVDVIKIPQQYAKLAKCVKLEPEYEIIEFHKGKRKSCINIGPDPDYMQEPPVRT